MTAQQRLFLAPGHAFALAVFILGSLAGGTVLAREFRAAGLGTILGPAFDIARSWKFGRLSESMGEDPFLVGCQPWKPDDPTRRWREQFDGALDDIHLTVRTG